MAELSVVLNAAKAFINIYCMADPLVMRDPSCNEVQYKT
jgi:hypothetical protein